jgi:hypothetical protein
MMSTNEKPNLNDSLVNEPSYEQLHGVVFKKKEKPKLKTLPLVPWSSVIVPANATDLEKLTYVPGLVGDITEWTVRAAPRPNRMMALCSAVALVGILIGRYVRGPIGSGTHLYLIMLALSGYGKDWPLQAGRKLLEALKKNYLIGPSEWSSSVGLLKALARNPLLCCFVDEFGDQISLLNNQKQNPFVWKTLGTLKTCFNSWDSLDTAETANRESVRIDWPALSVVGAATPDAFFSSFVSYDVQGGLVNRFLGLPYEGLRRPPEQEVPPGARDVPPDLIEKLKLLPQAPDSILEYTLDGRPAQLLDIPWAPGASREYYATSRKLDSYEGRRQVLAMRVCENANRFATIVAVGRGSLAVEADDNAHSLEICRRSFEGMVGGIDTYMREYYDFPKFCDEVGDAFRERGFISKRDLHRKFFRRQRQGFELDRVITELVKQERIEWGEHSSFSGTAAKGWKWVSDE